MTGLFHHSTLGRLGGYEGMPYAIRRPADKVLQESIAHRLRRPVGRPSNPVRRHYASFSYRAGPTN
jgi:hypothetical protein